MNPYRSNVHRLRVLALWRNAKYAVALYLATALMATLQAAPFENTLAQRVVACTHCHGPQGRAAADGYYPRLAGKPAGYLFQQLLYFREGQRAYGLMAQMVAPLSDAYLLEIAEYFSAMEVPYPPPTIPKTTSAERLRGAQLVQHGDPARKLPACASCHGTNLTGVMPATPGLLGLPRDYINAQLGAWRANRRNARAPDCMADIAKRLSPGDVVAVSGWLASQQLPENTHPAKTMATPLPMQCAGAQPFTPTPKGTQ